MPEIQVRYTNGKVEHWRLDEGFDLNEMARALTRSSATTTVSFGVLPSHGQSGYDLVGLRVGEIASWRVSGSPSSQSGPVVGGGGA